MKKYVLVLGLVGLSIQAIAAGKDFRLTKGLAYQIADSQLRNEGWQSRRMHVKNEYTYVGIETTLRDHGVQGIESCAGDRPVCIIHYAKRNKCLRVITWGEEFEELKIDSWSRECPPKDAL